MFRYYDLHRRTRSDDITMLFPGWRGKDEVVLVLAPHDDDAVLGPGFAVAAAQEHGAAVHVLVFHDGSAGYATDDERIGIVELRREETLRALARLDVPPRSIHRFELPDFTGPQFLGWRLPSGDLGVFGRLVPLARRIRATRLLIANGYREHIDHWGVHLAGLFFGPQAGDPVCGDWGAPCAIRSALVYSVWADFDPEDALLNRRDEKLRANRAVAAPPEVEQKIRAALAEWKSQAAIIDAVGQARDQRRLDDGHFLELYLALQPRPRLEYGPYLELVSKIDGEPK